MNISISDRLTNIPFSSIRKVFEKANEMEKNGAEITHMEIGRPDFDTPTNIKDAAIKALHNGKVHYTPNSGIAELKCAIAKKLFTDNKIMVDPVNGIVVTVGCKEAILDTVMAFINPGDEVLIPDPSWLEYGYIVDLAGGVPVSVPLHEEENYLLNPDDLKSSITPKTKLLILNTPQNPTGAVLPDNYLKQIANIVIENNLLVISDEIYEKLIYDNQRHVSIASFPELGDRTVTINGFSKAYSMDGWRLGYAAGPSNLIQSILKVHQYNTASATSFVQYGGIVAYTESQKSVDDMVKEFDQRRRLIVKRINGLSGMHCVLPKGAFYVFPSIKELGLSSKEFSDLLLEKAHIACVPGSAFGKHGEGHIRMSYSTSYDEIERAMDRLEAFVNNI